MLSKFNFIFFLKKGLNIKNWF